MPFVRIDLREGTTPAYRRAIADAIHQALVETIGIPPDDRFQVIAEHPADGMIVDENYLGIRRSERVVMVQITLSAGRKPAQKRDFYARAVELLAREPGLRPEDLMVSLVESTWENWSFGNGEAQYTK